ncbi:MAG: DUF4827 domain-containing protein [Prevotellaceae bacterium]|jgi:hypothetical protein|nr:DUF4827 domain-containing protein [Prevotellaceae bacterium]
MKKTIFALMSVVVMLLSTSCNHVETYAEQIEKENNAINKFIKDKGIKIISETEFAQKNYTTNVSQNEYVLIKSSGVYMQIVRQGCGEKIKDGETATVICRFSETNVMQDVEVLDNAHSYYYVTLPDKMSVKNTSGTFTASFDTSNSLMYQTYGSASVPAGWLAPMSYIKIGRPMDNDDEIAKVNLIVPHTQGHSYASSEVIPFFYTITYQRGS